MNLKYMKVSLFEISYKKKNKFFTILQFSEMHLYYLLCKPGFVLSAPKKKKKNPGLLHMKNHPLHMSKYKVVVFREKLAIYNG